MNGNFQFNDTLDNFTFPKSCKAVQRDENVEVTQKAKDQIGIISFDDSDFLNESFSIINNVNELKKGKFLILDDNVSSNVSTEREKIVSSPNFSNNCDIENFSSFFSDIGNFSSFNECEINPVNKKGINADFKITSSSINDSDLLKHIGDSFNCFKNTEKSALIPKNQGANDPTDLFNNSEDIFDCSNEISNQICTKDQNFKAKNNSKSTSVVSNKNDEGFNYFYETDSSIFDHFNSIEFTNNDGDKAPHQNFIENIPSINQEICYKEINKSSKTPISTCNKVEDNSEIFTGELSNSPLITQSNEFFNSSCTIETDPKHSENVTFIVNGKENNNSKKLLVTQKNNELLHDISSNNIRTSLNVSINNLKQDLTVPISLSSSVEISCDGKKNNTKDNEKKQSCELSDWNLPAMILQKYTKNNVTKMFEWQLECLSNEAVLLNNKNLVYSAPTSAGKTLVAEILGIKTLIERNKKVIFVLPFVSVVREKMFHFQDLLSTSGVRVDGFMGSYRPPGGFKTVQLAICTIEKANSLINRLLEDGELENIGSVIVDEMHLLGDPSRGYLLELLLTKLIYMTKNNKEIDIQIIGMSATLPNLAVLAKWLDAELFTTDFRPIPLSEQCHVQGEIYDNNLSLVRKLPVLKDLETDTDNILQLCLETIQSSCSVLIFCPTKNWCENLAQQIATAFWKLGNSKSEIAESLRSELNPRLITELLEQLKLCPVGLDKVLSKSISFGAAFHHAGLTMDERDIIEGGFRTGAIRVLVATSTLSSGVNLPARRVIIRTPNFHGKPLDTLTYRQMIGRAGRMGKDTAGESLLICQKNDYKIAKELMSAKLDPVESCLRSGRLKRAILEVIASGVASSLEDVNLFANCTLLNNQENKDELQNPIEEAINFLNRNEFIRLQTLEDGSLKYVATSLGKACLASSLPPEEGLTLFTELEKARQCFVLETELHLIYLVTPYNCCNQWGNIDWMFYLSLWEKLPASMKRVGELVGVRESYMVNASRGKIQTNTHSLYQKLQVHKRFYTALALQDLVNEVPLNVVASKFNCSRGLLQSLQQSASTFAGMVTSFSKQLGWTSVELLISQFQDRLHFGINRDLLDLMRLPVMNGPRARTLYNSGIETLASLASSSVDVIENILHKVVPFESEKEREGETKYDTEQRNKIKTVWVTGKQGLTEREAAEMLINDARTYIQLEMGLVDAKWGDVCKESGSVKKGMKKNVLYKKEKTKILNKEIKIGLKNDNKQYVEIKNSTPKVKNNTDSFSDVSLFESSFKEENQPAVIEHKLDSPEVDNLDLKLSLNASEIVTNVSNTSSEFVASSQNYLSNVDTPLKLISDDKNMTKKRKHSKHESNSDRSGDDVKETPSKKKKRSSRKSKGKIDPSLVIAQDRPFTTLMVQDVEDLKSVDLSNLDIVNVADNTDVFKSFRSEIRTQDEISLSIGCVQVPLTKPKIGVKVDAEDAGNLSSDVFNYGNREVKGISVCWGGNTAYYVSLESSKIPNEDKINIIKEVLANPDMKVRMFDGKEHIKVIDLCLGINFNAAIEDPKIGDWLLDPDGREKNLMAMAMKYTPEAVNLVQLVGSTKGVGSVGLDVHASGPPKLRSAVEAVVTWHLVQSVLDVMAQLEMKLLHAYYIEMSIIRILARMELTGFGVSLQKLEDLSNTLVQQNLALERKAFQIAGRTFSFTSTTDVAKILGLYQVKKRISTNKQVLERNLDNPIAPLVVQWRKINSILTRTVYPLLRLVKNDRIYGSCILQNATGRISMHEPNLQGIPRNFEARCENNKPILINCRDAFQAKEKFLLVSADYCQLELRLLAHFSKDKSLVQVMHNTSKDVFKIIAAKLNNVHTIEVTDEMRQNAKQICYGIIYGMGVKTLAEQMSTSEEEACVFLEMFHEKYPTIRTFIQKLIEKCHNDGFVETLGGRRRYLPNINSSHQTVKSQNERQAVNTTIQGSAADIAKNAMVVIDTALKEKFKTSRNKPELVLQLHDEFLYEVPEKYLSTATRIIKNSMENSVQLSVPFPAKVRVGKTWGKLEEKSIF